MGPPKQSSKPIKFSLKTPRSIIRLTTLFLSIICILTRHTTSTPSSNMMLSSELVASANQTLLSPGGVFEVGFTGVSRPSDGASPMIYTLAIWYAQILSATSGRTIVWMADRSMNLSSINATLQLSAQGNLEVHNDGNFSGQLPLWSSSTTGLNVTLVAMQDTGNLVLLNNLNQIVWQSFDNPTDTLLPGQQYIASANISMYAWQKDDNYTQSGCHVLKWEPNGILMASWMSPRVWLNLKDLAYWSSWVPSDYVILTTEGQFLAKSSSDNRITAIIASSAYMYNSTGARLNRLTFDYDGVLRMYSWDVSGGSENSWSVVWTGNSICSVWNYCGPYSICENSNCMCSEGFQSLDLNDPTQGCTRSVEINMPCTTKATTLQMIGSALIDYPFGDMLLQPLVNVSLSFCLQTCLDSCTCEACVYADSTGYCWLKTTLVNGRLDYLRTTYIKFAAQQSHSQETSTLSSIKKKLLIGFLSFGAFTLTLTTLLCTIGCFAIRRKVKILRIKQLEAKWTAAKGLIVSFTYNEIQLATKNFSQEIGKGGAGTVFKAEFGKHAIAAVKRLDKLHQAEEEKGFLNEIETIGLIRHVNLVELHGYCATADHKLLVYEYVENSSLDKTLFGKPDREHVLEWRCRYKIALQTARAVNHLHEDQGRGASIIHCDIKPENILLDSTMSAKVADFGLARILNWERTRTMTVQIHGTRGYMAPEWTQPPTPITTKIDVYSFGMVLFEIVSGRRNLKPSSNLVEADIRKPDWYFPLWAVTKLDSGSYMELVDPSLTQIADPTEVERALLVAFWCINERPEQRPSMSDVVQMLEGNIPIKLPVPRPKFLEMLMISSTLQSS